MRVDCLLTTNNTKILTYNKLLLVLSTRTSWADEYYRPAFVPAGTCKIYRKWK